jgi:small conductance mechanosensitive channel
VDSLARLTASDVVLNWIALFIPRLAGALFIFVIGIVAARWLSRALGRFLEKTARIDPTLEPVLVSIVRYTILILVLILALGQLGIQTTSLLAVLGAAGLAVGLALQGTLSNIAAGIMLLWLRPFRVGDFIEMPAAITLTGWVREIGLFACKLETYDGLFLFVPNSTLWNAPLKNHSRNEARMIVISITLGTAADVERARGALLELTTREGILPHPKPAVAIEAFAAQTIVLILTCWTSPSAIGRVAHALTESARVKLTGLGPEFVPQQIHRTIPGDADPSRFIGALYG